VQVVSALLTALGSCYPRAAGAAAPLALFGTIVSFPAAHALLLMLVFTVVARALVILKRRELARRRP